MSRLAFDLVRALRYHNGAIVGPADRELGGIRRTYKTNRS
jgi:hypothetical protein